MLETDRLLEQEGRVVDGSVASSELLEELRRGSNHHALELLGLAEGEEVADTAGGTGSLDISLHQIQVGEHTLVAFRDVVQGGQHLAGFVLVALLYEPSWRLREDTHANNHDDGEEDLESNGESPLDRGVDVAETEVDPVGDESSNSDNCTLQTDEETTVLGLRCLGLPDRNGRGIHSVSNTRDHTSDDELTECPVALEAGGGDDGSNDEDDATGKAKTCAANPLTEGEGEDGTKEASDFVAGSDSAANDRDVLLVRGARAVWNFCCRKFVVELGTRNETRHQALVVSEERETHDGGDGDSCSQLLAREASRTRPHGCRCVRRSSACREAESARRGVRVRERLYYCYLRLPARYPLVTERFSAPTQPQTPSHHELWDCPGMVCGGWVRWETSAKPALE